MYEFRLKFHWFFPKVSINNIPALVQIMAWCQPGDKPLFEPVMIRLPTHLYASLGFNELTHKRDPKSHPRAYIVIAVRKRTYQTENQRWDCLPPDFSRTLLFKPQTTGYFIDTPIRIQSFMGYWLLLVWWYSHIRVNMVVADGLEPIWDPVTGNHLDDVARLAFIRSVKCNGRIMDCLYKHFREYWPFITRPKPILALIPCCHHDDWWFETPSRSLCHHYND